MDRDAVLDAAEEAERAALEAVRHGEYAQAVSAYGMASDLYEEAGDTRQAWSTGLSVIQLFTAAPHLHTKIAADAIDRHFTRFLELGDTWAQRCDDLAATARRAAADIGHQLGTYSRQEAFFEGASEFAQGCDAFFSGTEVIAEHAAAQAMLIRDSLANVGNQYHKILIDRDVARESRGI